ncbi:MAG: trypsin-like peptidase domain-containing protein [Myxococcaceae bacterium]|nr:trypsin-like peptidase domain-containing protein [Myxococcaceae bacterium]
MAGSRRLMFVVVWLFSVVASAQARPALDAVFDKVDPAVVMVRVSVRHTEGDEQNGMRVELLYGYGAGVLLHEGGFIATAAHVVDQAEMIEVSYKDGTKCGASIVTLSRTEDLALLKAEKVPKGTVAAPLAEIDKIKVGQPVFAVGRPRGYAHSMSAGIISSVRNDPAMGLRPGHVIQTDAALNPGNSGGPLFNERGEVVGIASFIFSKGGGSEGLGFAIPAHIVKKRLFEKPLPYLGVSLRILPQPVMELFNWPYPGAMLVETVRPESPAAKAGLQGGVVDVMVGEIPVKLGGDLILKVGPHDAWKTDDIGVYLAGLRPGDSIEYQLLRKGQPLAVSVPVPPREVIPVLGPPKKK